MIHNDPTAVPTLLFIVCLAAVSVAVTLDSVLLMVAFSLIAAVIGMFACCSGLRQSSSPVVSGSRSQ